MANEINLFGVIGRTADGTGITAQQVKTALAAADQSEPLVVRIDSEGGSVFDGLSIYEAFANYPGPKKAIVESTAFSIASYIAMAFDEVEIAANGYLMVHEPSVSTDGTAEDLTKSAQLLSKLDQSMVSAYSAKTGLSEDEVRALMKDETFMNATEAMSWGFVNGVSERKVATRIAPAAKHKRLPQRVYAALFGAGSGVGDHSEPQEKPMPETQKPVAATIKEIKAAYPKMGSDFVLKCLEKEMPMASVASAAADELLSENEELKAKIAAMEEEMTALKAKAMEEEEPDANEEEEEPAAKAEGDEEEPEARATARVRGAKPVARARMAAPGKTATVQWREAVQACLVEVKDRPRAVSLANKRHPGLREKMLQEANSAQ